jgi:acetolactate synthase-1/3 small subunit
MKHTISVLSEDHPGVLMRIAGLIFRRGFNIESLSVGRTDTPGLSRFTIVIEGDEGVLDQVCHQLDKLIEVVEVRHLPPGRFVERALALIKVRASLETRHYVLQTAEIFRCRVVDLGSDAAILEVTGDRNKVEACLAALRPYGILEVAGSGAVAMERSGFREEGNPNGASPEALDAYAAMLATVA